MSIDNLNSNPELEQNSPSQKELLSPLEKELQKEYSFTSKELETLKSLFDTSLDIASLREAINSNEDLKNNEALRSTSNLETLYLKLSEIRREAKKEIGALKEEISSTEDIDFNPKATEKYRVSTKIISKKLINRAKKPQNIGDETIGTCIGIIDSTGACVQLAGKLVVDTVRLPKDIYDMATGKAYYDWNA